MMQPHALVSNKLNQRQNSRESSCIRTSESLPCVPGVSSSTVSGPLWAHSDVYAGGGGLAAAEPCWDCACWGCCAGWCCGRERVLGAVGGGEARGDAVGPGCYMYNTRHKETRQVLAVHNYCGHSECNRVPSAEYCPVVCGMFSLHIYRLVEPFFCFF